MIQIATSGCSASRIESAIYYQGINATAEFPGSFPVEAYAYEGQQRALDC